jgi:6-phosphogluconolactonase
VINEETPAASPEDTTPAPAVAESYEPPPPPRWASPETAAAGNKPRDKKMMALGVGSALVLAVALAVPIAAFTPVGDWVSGNDASTAEAATPVQSLVQSNAAGGAGLQKGAVFVNANDPKANSVIALTHQADGTLKEYGRYPTGGTGSGTAEDDAGGLVLGDSQGESSPVHLTEATDLLYVANSGSDTITVFKVLPDKLQKVTEVSTGGIKPVSITVSKGLLYVLNSGETDDRAIINNMPLENCTSGQLPSVTGFRVSKDGHLSQLAGSTKLLTGGADSGCSQASFTPDGRNLIVTERIAGKKDAAGLAKGAFNVFPVRPDGLLGDDVMSEPAGNGPFGFTFMKDGTLLATEQFGALDTAGHVVSYSVNEDSTITANQSPVANGRSDTCWIVLTNDQKMAFSTSALGNGAVSSYAVSKTGTLSVLSQVASATDGRTDAAKVDHTGITPIDLALSRDSQYLYAVGAIQGVVYTFKVVPNGTLAYVGTSQIANVTGFELGFVGVPMGIAAS